MKVLHISPRCDDSSGGDGLYAVNLVRASSSLGVEADVLTIKKGEFVHEDWHRNGQTDLSSFLPTTLRLAKVRRGMLNRNFYSAIAGECIARTIEKVTPDIVHVHGIHQYFTVAAVSPLRRFRGPKVITVHDYKLLCGNAGFFSDRTLSPCLRCLQAEVLPPLTERCKRSSLIESGGVVLQMALWRMWNGLDVFDAIHCGSEFVGSLLRQNPKIEKRVTTVQLPVLIESAPMSGPQAQRHNHIAFIGRMVPHKGPRIFAEAVNGMACQIDIYGDGPLKGQIESILKPSRFVRYHGWVGRDILNGAMGQGTIVVLPYLAHETFCYAAVEAMARGCCVVASARGAIPELIHNGVDGVLIQDPTATEFRRVILDLLSDHKKVLSIGDQATRIVTRIPSLTVHAEKMNAFYATTIGQRTT